MSTREDFGFSEINGMRTQSETVCWTSALTPEIRICKPPWVLKNNYDSLDATSKGRFRFARSGPNGRGSLDYENYLTDDEIESMDRKMLVIRTHGFAAVMTNFAAASTKYYIDESNCTDCEVLRNATAMQSAIRARWEWLAFPVALIVSSVAFLILTILETRRRNLPLWKSSMLATLYHGVEDVLVDDRRGGGYVTVSEMS